MRRYDSVFPFRCGSVNAPTLSTLHCVTSHTAPVSWTVTITDLTASTRATTFMTNPSGGALHAFGIEVFRDVSYFLDRTLSRQVANKRLEGCTSNFGVHDIFDAVSHTFSIVYRDSIDQLLHKQWSAWGSHNHFSWREQPKLPSACS